MKSDGKNHDSKDEAGVHVCENCDLSEITASLSSECGDWIDEDLGNQRNHKEGLSKVRSRKMRMVLLLSAKGTSQFRREITSALKPSILLKASSSHVTSLSVILKQQMIRGLHIGAGKLTGHTGSEQIEKSMRQAHTWTSEDTMLSMIGEKVYGS